MSSFKILAMYKQYADALVADNVSIIDRSVKVIDSGLWYTVCVDGNKTLYVNELQLKTIQGDMLKDYPPKEHKIQKHVIPLSPIQMLMSFVAPNNEHDCVDIHIFDLDTYKSENLIRMKRYSLAYSERTPKPKDRVSLMKWLNDIQHITWEVCNVDTNLRYPQSIFNNVLSFKRAPGFESTSASEMISLYNQCFNLIINDAVCHEFTNDTSVDNSDVVSLPPETKLFISDTNLFCESSKCIISSMYFVAKINPGIFHANSGKFEHVDVTKDGSIAAPDMFYQVAIDSSFKLSDLVALENT